MVIKFSVTLCSCAQLSTGLSIHQVPMSVGIARVLNPIGNYPLGYTAQQGKTVLFTSATRLSKLPVLHASASYQCYPLSIVPLI